MITLQNLTVRRDTRNVVDDVSLTLNPGECIGLLGPNGAGKTTLMRAALGLLPAAGQSSLRDLPPRERARHCAWLPQSREIAWPMSVETLVALGRLPHDTPDAPLLENILTRLGLDQMRHRPATELSGGEQARVLIARALVQDTPFLLADEPIAGLDPAAQISTMQLFRELAQQDRGILVSLHDVGLAARHCTRLILMTNGRIIADGPPDQVITPALLADVFGITAHVARGDGGFIFQPMDVIA